MRHLSRARALRTDRDRAAGPIGDRGDPGAVRRWRRSRTADSTVLTVDAVDQAAVRAVMIMLWDSGHEVLAMSTVAPADPSDRRSTTQLAVG